MSLPLASTIDVNQPGLPPSRSNTASPVPGRRQHFESDSDSDSDSDTTSMLGGKFITRYVFSLSVVMYGKCIVGHAPMINTL